MQDRIKVASLTTLYVALENVLTLANKSSIPEERTALRGLATEINAEISHRNND